MARRHTNQHHIKARSTFPPEATREEMDEDNIVELDERWHNAYHFLFGTLDPEQAKRMIDIVMQPDRYWDAHRLKRLRLDIQSGRVK